MQTSSMYDVAWSSSAFLQDPVDPTWRDQSLVVVFSTPAVRHLPADPHLVPTHNTSHPRLPQIRVVKVDFSVRLCK